MVFSRPEESLPLLLALGAVGLVRGGTPGGTTASLFRRESISSSAWTDADEAIPEASSSAVCAGAAVATGGGFYAYEEGERLCKMGRADLTAEPGGDMEIMTRGVRAPTLPPTVVCKMEAQLEYVHIACTFLHVWH